MASEVLERTLAPLRESLVMTDKSIDALYPDGEKSQIFSRLTAYTDYASNLITSPVAEEVVDMRGG